MIKRILSAGALALLFGSCLVEANAAFYLRPEVQFGFLADGHSDADMGVGGALAWGGSFGQDQRYEVGVEFSNISYKGKFDVMSYTGTGSGDVAWKKVADTYNVTPVQATFRYIFLTKNTKIRPYLGMSLGYNWVDFASKSEVYMDGNSVVSWAGSFGGGLNFRLGRRTSANLGYRYFFSEKIGPSYAFRNNAHIFTIAITQLFGGLRK